MKNNFQKPSQWKNKDIFQKWQKLFEIKQQANVAIEEKRANKELGSSLEAQIKIYTNKEQFDLLKDLDLAEYFITSKAEVFKVNGDEKKIVVSKAEGKMSKVLENFTQNA